MVRISLQLIARRGDAKHLATALRALVVQAQGEQGCIGCRLFSDVTNANALCYIEEWLTESALRGQIRSERFHRLIAIMEAAAERPRFEVQVVTVSHGLEYLEAMLRTNDS